MTDTEVILFWKLFGGGFLLWFTWTMGKAKGYLEAAEKYRFPRGTIRVNSTKDVDCEFTTEKANHEPS